MTDQEILALFREQFVAAGTTTATASATVDHDVFNSLVESFQGITDQAVKIECLQTVHAAANGTHDHIRSLYNTLPDGDHTADHTQARELTKQALKHHVWVANGNRSVGHDGNDHGLHYGDWFFNNITPDVLRDALARLHHVVTTNNAASTSSATSATSTTASDTTSAASSTATDTSSATTTGTGP